VAEKRPFDGGKITGRAQSAYGGGEGKSNPFSRTRRIQKMYNDERSIAHSRVAVKQAVKSFSKLQRQLAVQRRIRLTDASEAVAVDNALASFKVCDVDRASEIVIPAPGLAVSVRRIRDGCQSLSNPGHKMLNGVLHDV